ncbi:hypothetical protein BHE74_00029874 [Ensete ventricosum]|nr:hypothetical protein GW17_00001802 [Ensete ventricosum]RWW62977.1 hypothetical protein BHE74_00029874 [Ensete ventricosum]
MHFKASSPWEIERQQQRQRRSERLLVTNQKYNLQLEDEKEKGLPATTRERSKETSKDHEITPIAREIKSSIISREILPQIKFQKRNEREVLTGEEARWDRLPLLLALVEAVAVVEREESDVSTETKRQENTYPRKRWRSVYR